MSTLTQGRRLYLGRESEIVPSQVEVGDYWKDGETGVWSCCVPNGLWGNLANHTVVENQDGTITVSPSILVWNKESRWHGFLENGVWREA